LFELYIKWCPNINILCYYIYLNEILRKKKKKKKKEEYYDKNYCENFSNNGKKFPTIANGTSKISLLIVKQNAQGTVVPWWDIKLQVVITHCCDVSNAINENCSQYSTADELSINF